MVVDVPGRKVARVLKWLADGLWWLGLASGVAVLVLLVVHPLVGGSDFESGTGVWVSLADGPPLEELTLTSPDTMVVARPMLEEVRAKLEFDTRSRLFLVLANLSLLPWMAVILLCVHLVRSFLGDVLRGRVFTATNASRLARLAWLLLAIGVVGPWVERARGWYILRRIALTGITLSLGPTDWVAGTVYAGAMLLFIAAVWRYGVELQDDHNLTV